MHRLIFYVDPEADPLVEDSSVMCADDTAMIDTSLGPKHCDSLVVGDYYRFGTNCRKIDAIEVL